MTAFRVENSPRPSHEFNFSVVGVGERHPNVAARETEVRVSLPVAVAGDLLASQVREIECVVDTGATRSLFSGDLAQKLKLELPQDGVRCSRVGQALGTTEMMYVPMRVAVKLGSSEFFRIPVSFPVEYKGTCYVWKSLDENLLGMKGLLS